MLKAYVRRYDGVTHPVTVRHQGQHLGVHDGKVRFARLYWERPKLASSNGDGEEAGYAVLEEAVPLLDTLIVTRVSPVNGERAVFHGTLTEASADNSMISLIAVDNPQHERLYDQPWWNDAPLYPSDQAAPEHPAPFPAAQPQPQPQPEEGTPPQGVRTLGGLPLLSVLPQTSDRPAARPGGHPAAPPAGSWQPAPQAAAQA